MFRTVLGVSICAAAMALGAATAQAQQQWQSYEYQDSGGRWVAELVFGIPQTDAIRLLGFCSADNPGLVDLSLFGINGGRQPGSAVTVTFSTARYLESRSATIRPGDNEEFGPYVNLILDRYDALWEVLMSESNARMVVGGGSWADMHLSGSRVAISSFLSSCDWVGSGGGSGPVVGGGGGGGLEPLLGPLFVVSGGPAQAYSELYGGVALPSFPSGTELMATNAAGNNGGVEWVEVVADRGAGATAWVERARLSPTSGGATEYQNLNQVAALLLRSSPSANGSVVGSIPANATGVQDQGQRQGNWVLVSYANLTGWASHDYLVPMLAPAILGPIVPDYTGGPVNSGGTVSSSGLGQGGGNGSPSIPPAYQASYGGWEVYCDACASYEEPVCVMYGGDVPDGLAVVADYADPTRIGDVRVGMELFGGTRGTLTLLVDGEVAALVPPSDLTYMEMTGEFLVEPPYVDSLLTAMVAGNNLAAIFTSTNGQTRSFSTSLNGFSDGVSDLLATSPGYPRDASCR